ncbi:putative tyrosinase copper-binding domain-containing protein [Plasmopara halstedii]
MSLLHQRIFFKAYFTTLQKDSKKSFSSIYHIHFVIKDFAQVTSIDYLCIVVHSMTYLKLKSMFLSWWITLLLVSTTSSQQVGTNCTDPRIRRSWDTYNATEKALYLEAVGSAMDKGFHQKFIQVHTEFLSEKEAHGNCMFIYWHRMLLLGYENMLRSLNSKYRCLTLPYWDHVSARARRATGSCTNLLTCTPFLSDSSGDMSGTSKSLIIYDSVIPLSSSTCMNRFPLSQFCGNNTVCAKCITRKTRNAMTNTAYPDSASFASVYQQLFSSNDSSVFTSQVERGVHNTIHSALGGVMAYFESPADPIFYLHHALIDLLQIIYFKCQVGGENVILPIEAKGNDTRWFRRCAKRSSGTYTTTTNITIRGLAFDGKTVVNVWEDPQNILYPFFKDLPSRYVDYVDAKDLGNYSYTYAMSGGLATFYQKCWTSNQVSAVTTLLADERQNRGRGKMKQLEPVLEPGSAYDEKVKRLNIALYETARIVGYEETAANEQMEMVMCQYQQDCLGGVLDYSDIFRANFGVEGHPRCYTILQYLNSGDKVIGIPQWKFITSRFLPCAAYQKKENPLSNFGKAVGKMMQDLGRGEGQDQIALH